MTRQELADRIKRKYPSYRSVGDDQLVAIVLEKYPEYRELLSVEERALAYSSPSIGQIAGGMGAEASLSLGGQALGAATGPLGWVAFSFTGGFLGSVAAQRIEGRDHFSWGRAFAAGITNVLFPGVGATKTAGTTVARQVVSGAARGAAQGATLGTVDQFVQKRIDENRNPTLGELAISAGAGANFGTILGGSAPKLKQIFTKHSSKTLDEIDEAVVDGEIPFDDLVKVTGLEEAEARWLQGDTAQKVLARKAYAAQAEVKTPRFARTPDGNLAKNPQLEGLYRQIGNIAPGMILPRQIKLAAIDAKNSISAYEEAAAKVFRTLEKDQLLTPENERAILNFLEGGEYLPKDLMKHQDVLTTFKVLRQKLTPRLGALVQDETFTELPLERRVELANDLMQANVRGNQYLTRQYRIHHDESYLPSEKAKQEAIQETKELILRNDESLSEADALNAAQERVERHIRNSAYRRARDPRAEPGDAIRGIIFERTDPGPKMRAFLGEYDTPQERMAETLSHSVRLIANREMEVSTLDALVKSGLAVKEEAEGMLPLKLSTFVVEGAKEYGETGYFVAPETAMAVQKALYGKAPQNLAMDRLNWAMQAWKTLVSGTKASRVVLNPASLAPQVWGNLWQLGTNSHLISENLPKMLTGGKQGWRVALDDLRKESGVKGDTLMIAHRVKELGLAPTQLTVADIREGIKGSKIEDAARDFLDPAGRLFSVPDIGFRVANWYGDMAALREIAPNASQETLEAAAARLTNLTFQNYDYVPDAIRKLAQVGVTNPFFLFTSEMIRTTYNQNRLALKMLRGELAEEFSDLDLGALNQSRMASEGAKRLMASVSGLGLAGSIPIAWNIAAGVDMDEQEKLRQSAVPEWDRDNQLVFLPNKDDPTKGTYFNPSYLFPTAVLSDAVDAAVRGVAYKDFANRVAGYFANQVLGQGSFPLQAVMGAITNRDQYNRPVSVSQGELQQASERIGWAFSFALEPGFVREAAKWDEAFRGVGDYEQWELASRLMGMRQETYDLKKSAQFKAADAVDDAREAIGTFRGAQYRQDLTPQGMAQVYERSNNQVKQAMGEVAMHARNMMDLGVSKEETVEVLKEAGVSSRDILATLEGRYSPFPRERRVSAEDMWDEIPGSQEEKLKYVRDLRKTDPLTADRLINFYKRQRRVQRRNLKPEEKLLYGMSNEAKADYLIETGLWKNDAEVQRLGRKGIINANVMRIVRLKTSTN